MFPGHSSSDWLFVVNGWVVGGMAGAFSCGYFADRYGRKSTLTANCFVIVIAAVVQAFAPTLPVFVVGRVIAGIASGTATAICNGYASEVTPPHLQGTVGTFFVFAIALGLFLASIAFFIAGTSTGWRYIAGFPIVLALIILGFSRQHLVESPAWLFLQQRDSEAEDVLSQLYGKENVVVATQWTKTKAPSTGKHKVSWKSLFAVRYRRQVILAVHFALSAQFTGINAVFFYSSILFKTAGIKDGRFGTLIVSLLYLLPSFAVPCMVRRFGNRKMLIGGHFAMLLAAVGLTIALVSKAETLSIAFVALYAAIFSLTLCALMFPTAATIFPDDIRATGMSLVMLVNWIGTLVIGVGYPYVASALNDLAFLPFIVSLVYFVIFMYKFLPNTTGKTNDEIQQVFDTENNTCLN
ncbi:hypothetical protein Poli38472_001165 [Pythium oligandrum]|uniref:Hexose transporter 1 n=1 Tax=Pythium oligandrum TaxID=41045 RepID=A0A8K1CSZ8_PYTOL|nr:hypothetical protein Poli38472_001165 [Pythium oligandrum]|eukprot:TMW69009.1 hypothetical protein Poli38472_001165 [Pythium oligandrum]